MKCPKCKNVDLKATKLEDGLPVHGCDNCGGSIVSLLYYRDWLERTPSYQDDEYHSDVSIAEDVEGQTAIACPKCSRLMTKFSISGRTSHKLDLCTSCDESWLDGGEWELLKTLHLSKKVPSVFTDAWQSRVRKEISEIKLTERFSKIIGKQDMTKVEELRRWLRGHPKKAEILFYLAKD